MRYYCGIDLGKQGGISIINQSKEIILCRPLPMIEGKRPEYDIRAIVKILEGYKHDSEDMFCVIEKNVIIPRRNSAIAIASMAYCRGLMEGICSSLGFSYQVVPPKQWQEDVLQGMDRTDTKQAGIVYCQRMYPEYDFRGTERCTTIHDGKTDSLCLAIYAWNQGYWGV